MFKLYRLHKIIKSDSSFKHSQTFSYKEEDVYKITAYVKTGSQTIICFIWFFDFGVTEIGIARGNNLWRKTSTISYTEYTTVKNGNVSIKKIYPEDLAANTIRRAWKLHRERLRAHRSIREQFEEWAFRPWNPGGQFIINRLNKMN